MRAQTALFSRQYRAALRGHLLGSGEAALARAYELGRTAIDGGLGLVPILRAHQDAIQAILKPSHRTNETLERLMAAEDFLTEVLSSFEMTYRGYMASLEDHRPPHHEQRSSGKGHDHRPRRSNHPRRSKP